MKPPQPLPPSGPIPPAESATPVSVPSFVTGRSMKRSVQPVSYEPSAPAVVGHVNALDLSDVPPPGVATRSLATSARIGPAPLPGPVAEGLATARNAIDTAPVPTRRVASPPLLPTAQYESGNGPICTQLFPPAQPTVVSFAPPHMNAAGRPSAARQIVAPRLLTFAPANDGAVASLSEALPEKSRTSFQLPVSVLATSQST